MCVTFASATHRKAANLDALYSKGYEWAAPPDRIDATQAPRGVYINHQWRHDLYVPEGSEEVELMAIDPTETLLLRRLAQEAACIRNLTRFTHT